MQTFGSMERRTESQKGTVTGLGRVVRLALGIAVAAATAESALAADGDTIRFQLFPNKSVVHCLAASDAVTPTVDVVVRRGRLNDKMKLYLKNFKPGLNFDLFTVQRSPQLADGAADPEFVAGRFGLAWYQSDIHVNEDDDSEGEPSKVEIKTILLDQIFGFDSDVALPPTNTFHVGFWFNDPNDAADCGFNVNKPTPFNGEHRAGPLAFISRPDAITDLSARCVPIRTCRRIRPAVTRNRRPPPATSMGGSEMMLRAPRRSPRPECLVFMLRSSPRAARTPGGATSRCAR